MKKISFNENWVYHLGGESPMEALLGTAPQKPVTLPHDGSIELPRIPTAMGGGSNGFFQERSCYYTKTFTPAEADRDKEFLLAFEGVYQNCFVYVNGAFAGKHPYGYTPFALHLTPYLHFGQPNTIKVVIKNNLASSRWYTGTGIYRKVHLLVGNRLHLAPEGVHLTTVSAEKDLAVVRCEAVLRHTGLGVQSGVFVLRLLDEDGTPAAEASMPVTIGEGEEKTLRLHLYVKQPRLWSVDSPQLYGYAACIQVEDTVMDEETGTFGIRTLQLDPVHGLRINGQSIKLRGGCIHHDNGIIGAMEFPHAAEERVRKLKAAGYNAIRSAHNPISTDLLRACDRLGMLVMDEFSDAWTNAKAEFDYGAHMTEWWQQDIAAMVHKDYNHPSVIFYSIGNEICEAGNRLDAQWGHRFTERIRQLDPSRYVTLCLNFLMCVLEKLAAQYAGGGLGEINTTMNQLGPMMEGIVRSDLVARATEEAFSQVDAAGYNYAAMRYKQDGSLYPNRIILGSETYPSDLDTNWALVKKLPYVIGDFSWTAWDYLGEVGIGRMLYDAPTALGVYADFPYKAAYCGDFTLTGRRRPVSYWREIIWGLRSKPYLAVRPPQHRHKPRKKTEWCFTDAMHSWNWEGWEGQPVTVEVYAKGEEAALYCNGRCLEKKPIDGEKQGIALFETVYTPGTLEVIAYEKGEEIGRDCLVTAGAPAVLSLCADRAGIPRDGGDICYVDICLLDKDGRLHPGACPKVSVEVTGPGVLLGFGSDSPDSEENYFDTAALPFEGRLRGALRATGKGEITLTARAEGCAPASVHIQAE